MLDDVEKIMVYAWEKSFSGVDYHSKQGFEVVRHGFKSPDDHSLFVNSRIKFGDTIMEGSVKIINDVNKWRMWNSSYKSNVILVVTQNPNEFFLSYDSKPLRTASLTINREFINAYNELLYQGRLVCGKAFQNFNDFEKEHILTQLVIERLNDKCDRIASTYRETNENWSNTCLASLFDAMMVSNKTVRASYNQLIKTIGYYSIISNLISGDTDEDILNMEALLFGSAGLLSQRQLNSDDYAYSLRQRFDILRKHYNITPMSFNCWSGFTSRSGTIDMQLAQLASLIITLPTLHHSLIEITKSEDIYKLLKIKMSPYWFNHSSLGRERTTKSETIFTKSKIELIIINFIVPYLFFYNTKSIIDYDDEKSDKLLDILNDTAAESHSLVTPWGEYLSITSAFQSQAATQLSKMYCKKKDCFRCRIGRKYLDQFSTK